MQKALFIVTTCLFAVLALTGDATAAERDERGKAPLPKPPPQPVEYSLKVKRGEKLLIPLKIYGSQREALRFLIRKEPAAGKLSKVQTVDRESARVTYDPPADLEIVNDRFSYAVRNSAGVSASVDVNIAIVDDPPVLGIPDTVEFTPVLAGQKSEQTIEVANRGGGMAVGQLEVEEPWSVEGEAEYRLGAGESAAFKLVYQPTAGGANRGELKFSSDRTRTVALRGQAIAPVSVDPATLELTLLPGEPVRTGAFQLLNGTATPQMVKFSPSPRLQVRESVEVPANGRVVVTVQSSPEEVAGIAEDLVMSGAGIQVRLPVRAKPVGAVLRRISPDLDFGSSSAPQIVEVQNVGGAEGYWKWEPLSPFNFSEDGFRLPPGAKKQITVSLQNGAAGNLRAVLKLVGEQQTIEVPVVGALPTVPVEKGRSAKAGATGAKSSKAAKRAATNKPAITNVGLIGDDATDQPRQTSAAPSLGRVKAELAAIEPGSAIVVWPQVGSGKYRLEERQLSKRAGDGLAVTWRDFQGVQWGKEGDRISAHLKKLQPGQAYFFRVIDTSQAADALPIGHFQIVTPQKKPLVIFTPLRGLFLLLLVLLGTMLWQRRRAR